MAKVRIWDASSGRLQRDELRHAKPISKLLFRSDGKVLTTFSNSIFWLWDLETSRMLAGPIQCADRVTGAAFSPDGAILAMVTYGSHLERRDGRTGDLIGPVLILPDVGWDVAFSPDGLHFTVGYGYPSVMLDGKTRQAGAQMYESNGNRIGSPLAHNLGVKHVVYRDDGKAILTGDTEGTTRLWSAVDGKPLTPPMRGEAPVSSLAFSPDRHFLLVGSGVGTARLWNADDGRQVGATMEQAGEVRGIFQGDGRSIVLAGDQVVRVLDTADVQTPTLRLHNEVRTTVAFRPDGKAILTCGEDNSARDSGALWTAGRWQCQWRTPRRLSLPPSVRTERRSPRAAKTPWFGFGTPPAAPSDCAPIAQSHWICTS